MAFLLSNLANKNYQSYTPKFGDVSLIPTSQENIAIADSVQSQLDKQSELAKKQKLSDQLSQRFKEMNPAYSSAVKSQLDSKAKVGYLKELQDLYLKDEETKLANKTKNVYIEQLWEELDQIRSDLNATQTELNQLDPSDLTSIQQLQSEIEAYKTDMKSKMDEIEKYNKELGIVGETKDQSQQLYQAKQEQLQADKNLVSANETNPYGIYADVAQVDPMTAFKEHNDLIQKQASSKIQSDWESAGNIGEEIDKRLIQIVNTLKKSSDGSLSDVDSANVDKLLGEVSSLKSDYRTITNGKEYHSSVNDTYRQIAMNRRDLGQGNKDAVEMNIKQGDVYDKLVKDSIQYVQSSELSKKANTLMVLKKQIDNLTGLYKSNPANTAVVRAIVVAFNKFLEPSSAVMEGDFNSTTGVPSKGVGQLIQEVGRIRDAVSNFVGLGDSGKSENPQSYIISVDQTKQVKTALDKISGLGESIKNAILGAGATELVERLRNPAYINAKVPQLTPEQAFELMRRTSGLRFDEVSNAEDFQNAYDRKPITLPTQTETSENEKTPKQQLEDELAKEKADKLDLENAKKSKLAKERKDFEAKIKNQNKPKVKVRKAGW